MIVRIRKNEGNPQANTRFKRLYQSSTKLIVRLVFQSYLPDNPDRKSIRASWPLAVIATHRGVSTGMYWLETRTPAINRLSPGLMSLLLIV
jgi:hypothetical protein